MKLSFILVLSLDSELFDHFSGFETEFESKKINSAMQYFELHKPNYFIITYLP